MSKYTYYKVIQSYYNGHGWEDVDYHECNSTGAMTQQGRQDLRGNVRAYRDNQPELAHRVIQRRELQGAL